MVYNNEDEKSKCNANGCVYNCCLRPFSDCCSRCQNTEVEKEGVLNDIRKPCLVDTANEYHMHEQQ